MTQPPTGEVTPAGPSRSPYGPPDPTMPLSQQTPGSPSGPGGPGARPPYAGPRPTTAYPEHPRSGSQPGQQPGPPGQQAGPPRPTSPYGYGQPPWGPPPAPTRTGGRGVAAGVLAGALVLGLVAGVGGAAIYERLSDTRQVEASQVEGLDPLDVVSVNTVAKKVLPSVVKITAIKDDGSGGTGSGSVISADGEIITNNHVVEIADTDDATLTVSFNDGTNKPAELIGRDPRTDLALIKVTDATDLPPIALADSDRAEVGQAVVAVGSPYGLDSTVTAGIISALHRPVVMPLEDGSDDLSVYGAIQTDAPINPGNSGGALVNMAGQLVGVNSIIRLASGSQSDSQGDLGNIGIGYAIPVNEVMPIIDELRKGDQPTHARLGVSGKTAEFSPGVTGGAEVDDVSDGSAADKAGLESGDVVTKLGAIQVGSYEGLLAAVYSYRPGDTQTITFERDGDTRTAEVTFDSDADS